MGRSLLIVSVISSAVSIFRILSSLSLIYLTLDWKVRKAKKAFEKELINVGMPKEAVKRMSARYAALKDETLDTLKSRIIFFQSFFDQNKVDEFADERRLQILGIKF